MSPSLTNWTAGQNARRKAGAEHAAHGFAAQREENHNVPGYIQNCAFGIVLLPALNNRLHYHWEAEEKLRENVIHKHLWFHQSPSGQAFLIYLLPICLSSYFYAHLKYVFLAEGFPYLV